MTSLDECITDDINKLFSILTERFAHSDQNKIEDMKLLIKEQSCELLSE